MKNRGIRIGGNVSGSNLIVGDDNVVEGAAIGDGNQVVGPDKGEVEVEGDITDSTIVQGDGNVVKRKPRR